MWSRDFGSVEIKLSFRAGHVHSVCEVNHAVMWSAAEINRSELVKHVIEYKKRLDYEI